MSQVQTEQVELVASPEEEPRFHREKGEYMKILSAGFSFFVAGVNDGSIGALLPYVIKQFHVSTALVSIVYGANFLGWLFAAVANTHLLQYFDLGLMLTIGAGFQALAHALRSWNPPFALFVVTFWLVSVGQAFQDTHANTFVARIKGGNAHRWLAFIHASYMAGSLLGPFVSTAIASAGTVSRWYLFYTFPLSIGVINVTWVAYSFRDSLRLHKKRHAAEAGTPTGAAPDGDEQLASPSAQDAARDDEAGSAGQEVGGQEGSKNKDAMRLIKETLATPSVWSISLFYFFYLGSALTASGWVVKYLVDVRHGELSRMGFVPAGFNGGCLLGRLLLAEPTYRFGERRMILVYCVVSIGLQLAFWFTPNIIAESIFISLIGFFTGPMFQVGISVGTKLFPSHVQPTALALIFVCAQMGGSIFPVITGVIAAAAGVKVLQPILVGSMAAMTIAWILVPRPKSLPNTASHQE
ncbi:Bypass of stop codon protein 6 [Escovopsis weberi]|uniref:Bypass of stop codon protein 6 n=1 Tax=Escovopsis weberi TaxID=150374 RepID=A0A0M8N4X0_ESCWE|nr:Bypass of stop codon protein 6 [Escovopsis weberi]